MIFIFITFVTGLEFVYYLGPNCEHSFLSTLPGAVFAIAIWLLGSSVLNFYLGHLSNFNATYGSMGAMIGLMLWFYITALAILVGAELNAELAKTRNRRDVPAASASRKADCRAVSAAQ